MRRLVALLLALALATAASGCGGGGDDGAEAASPFARVAEQAVRDMRDGRAALLDVRTAKEFAAGHAPGVEHVPLSRIEAGAKPDVPKEARLYVYCRTGNRAAAAVKALRAAGFRDVTNIGGLRDWQRAGGAVVR